MSDAVASPCVGICDLDDRDICKGCGRTKHEIVVWPSLTDEQRRNVARCAEHRLNAQAHATQRV